LIARLENTVLNEKMIEEDLSRVDESATKSIYKLGVGFERCEKKGEKSAPTFVPSSNYHKEEESLKPTKTHYPSNPKPSFNPKREVKRESSKSREEAFICMFCGHVSHLDEFYFRCKRIEKMHFDYARNSYRDEFSDFFLALSLALCLTLLLVLCLISLMDLTVAHMVLVHERTTLCLCFGYGLCPHRGDRFSRRSDFPAGGSHTHFELRHLDGPGFPHRGSHPTWSSDVVQKIVKTFSCRMVKCWISKIYLTNPSTEPLTSSRPM
jgi:hypothetical protein